MLKSSSSRHSMSRTYGPRDMISLVIPRVGDNTSHKYAHSPNNGAPSTLVCILSKAWCAPQLSMLKRPSSMKALSQSFPHEQVRPKWMVHPLSPSNPLPLFLSFTQLSQVRMNLILTLLPPLASLWPNLKDQWPRLDLAKSNQWVRSHLIKSHLETHFAQVSIVCFMSFNSPTL
jgi:hypothetical protein